MALSVLAQKSLDKVIDKFKTGDLSPIVKMAYIQVSKDAPCSKWTFSNRVLAWCQSGELDCRGYKQWQKVGRKVSRGTHGVWIWGPRHVKKKDRKTGEEEHVFAGFIPICVHPYSHTEGDEISFSYSPKEPPPLLRVAKRLKVDVKWMPMVRALGNSNTEGSQIQMGTDDPEVFFHELAHAAHAKLNGKLKGGQHESQEVVAEFTACVLMALYGLGDRTGNCWNYIRSYAEDPLKAIGEALKDVGAVLELLEGEVV